MVTELERIRDYALDTGLTERRIQGDTWFFDTQNGFGMTPDQIAGSSHYQGWRSKAYGIPLEDGVDMILAFQGARCAEEPDFVPLFKFRPD